MDRLQLNKIKEFAEKYYRELRGNEISHPLALFEVIEVVIDAATTGFVPSLKPKVEEKKEE